ncbi:MAG: endonuclease III domain-containing protein [Phycisphaerae bacterium]
MKQASILETIGARLLRTYGPQHWWPAKTATEVVIGAILTQNTAWTNVERAISNLQRVNALSWQKLDEMPEPALAELIRPSGTFRVKARRIKAFVSVLVERFDGSLAAMLSGDLTIARAGLLEINGIGPETADAILLYAGHRPVFVVDAYTRRILRRHGLIEDAARYAEIQSLFHEALPADVPLFNEYHALLVHLGKRHCRAQALCTDCPLADLPHDESR